MAAPRSIEFLALNDDILAEILIRLPTLSDLGRACAVCVVFRRVITSHSFLRRMYKLHPPSLLGFRTFTGLFQPVEPPHPSSVAAYSLAGGDGFRFLFLPCAGYWVVRDVRMGRFILDYDEHQDGIFTKIAVCDPLTQRYVILPSIPQVLPPSTLRHASTVEGPHSRRYDVFLAPCGEEEHASKVGDPESFRIFWIARCPSKVLTFVFSSVNWEWRTIASPNWLYQSHEMSWRSYAYGCFYWSLGSDKLVVLDTSRMEFSCVSRLPFAVEGGVAIVELGGSKRGMFVLHRSTGSTVLRLFSAYSQKFCARTTEWVLENEVSLSSLYKYRILGDADGKLILQRQSFMGEPEFSSISLDFKTLQIQRIRGMLRGGHSIPFLYIGYPPSLSLPSI